MESYITNDEIKKTWFSILDDKASGPDDYTSLFFKKSWDIIGKDFLVVVKYFFDSSTIFKCVNTTRIALIFKIETPSIMNDFRPISFCNMIYKCISKVIKSRLNEIFLDIISHS